MKEKEKTYLDKVALLERVNTELRRENRELKVKIRRLENKIESINEQRTG